MSIKWDGETLMGDVRVNAMIHESGTQSLSFTRYSGLTDESRYLSIGFQFKAEDIDCLLNLLEQMRTQREQIKAREMLAATESAEAAS